MGVHVELEFSHSATANLLYQLDCLADVHRCSKPVYEALWNTELSFDGDDEAAIKEWSRIRRGYRGSVREPGLQRAKLALPWPGDGIYLHERLKAAAFDATDLGAFLHRVAVVNSANDLAIQRQVLARFEPRFERWWNSGPSEATKSFNADSLALFKSAKLGELTDKVSRFYDAKLPPRRIVLHPMIRPRSEDYRQTSGTQIGRHAVFEVVRGEQPNKRMPVVLHEVFHYFYESMRRDSKATLLKRFVESDSVHATVAYGLLNEVMAAALGNGLVAERVDPEEFAKDMAKPKGLYFDSEIDAGAKASLELVRKAVDGDGTMMLSNPVFIDAYVATVGKAVGDVVTPATSLRTHVASSDTELEVSADRMGRKIRASSIYGFTPADEKAVKFFKAYPTMNATLFATPKSIAGDKALLQLIPKQHRKEVQREARKKAPFIYAAPRSNKSWLYIFVADDVKTADELVATFVDLSKARVGVLQP